MTTGLSCHPQDAALPDARCNDAAAAERRFMSETARFQETLRRLALVDEAFVGCQAGLGLCAAPDVATALGYDVVAALEDPDNH